MSDILEFLDEQKPMVDPVTYKYYDCLSKRQLIVGRDIGEDFIEKITLPYLEMDNDGTGEEITIFITTFGGSVFHGMTLVDAIEKCKTKTKLVGLGLCMSMGLSILCSGKDNENVNRVCYPSTVGLLHSGSVGVQGDSNQAKDYIDFSNKYDKEIIEPHILKNTKITKQKFRKQKRVEQYMIASDMLELGIVDEIL